MHEVTVGSYYVYSSKRRHVGGIVYYVSIYNIVNFRMLRKMCQFLKVDARCRTVFVEMETFY